MSVEFLGMVWGPKEDVVIKRQEMVGQSSISGTSAQPYMGTTTSPVCVYVCVCVYLRPFFLTYKHILMYSHVPKIMCFFGFRMVIRRLAF